MVEKVALTPLGSPVAEKVTAELNPVPLAVVNVTGAEPPRATLGLVVLAVSVKTPRTFKVRV